MSLGLLYKQRSMDILPYDLRAEEKTSEIFYQKIDELTREIIFKGSLTMGGIINHYSQWTGTVESRIASQQECLLDMLIFSTL
jgi:hypothetical protein